MIPELHTASIDPFERWATRLVLADELSQRSADKYRPLWQAWCGWLLVRDCTWVTVPATLIASFFQGAAPGQGGRRRAIHASHMSSYTRQRYWRLLRGVYASAVDAGLLVSSPVLEVSQAQRPAISSRDRQSQVLDPGQWARLREVATMERIIPVKTAADWWHRRDRALLAVLVATGITTGELIALCGMDLTRVDRRPIDLGGVALAGDTVALLLEVRGEPESRARSLALPALYTPLVREWLGQREVLLTERAARAEVIGQGTQAVKLMLAQAPLFLARRARGGSTDLPGMEAVTVYYSVSQALKKLRRMDSTAVLGVKLDVPYVAKGPAVIRNSMLHEWLLTVGVAETVKRAGLKDLDSLRFDLS
jgi:integrase